MTPREARIALLYACEVAGLRGYDDIGALVVPPAVVVGPPALTYGAYGSNDPTEAVFTVFAVVGADERAADNLDELLPHVVEAICSAELDVVVPSVQEPGFFVSGNTNLPCYRIRAEVAL